MKKIKFVHGGLSIVAIIAILGIAAFGAKADTPPSGKKLMADSKLSPEALADWEEEQIVPPAWLEGAKKEGALRISGTWENKEFRELTKSFSERYPFIKFNYSRGSNATRARVPLVAFREGRYVTDVVMGIGNTLNDFREINALATLKDLPNLKYVPDYAQSEIGDLISVSVRYWCMSYNTKLISKEEMPKTWEDVLTTKKFYDGRLVLWRGASSWLLPVWHEKGAAWTTDWIHKVFNTIQPQKRKEGAVALVNLVAVGEFNASVGSAEYQVKRSIEKGAPVGFHCPDVVPMTSLAAGVLRDNPDINASKIFMNWLLSKEGQVAQYLTGGGVPPVHRDLQAHGLMPFPNEIAGKKMAFRSPELFDEDFKAMIAVLQPIWEGAADTD